MPKMSGPDGPVSKGIMIDKGVWSLIRKTARKFDTPNMVLRRLLGLDKSPERKETKP